MRRKEKRQDPDDDLASPSFLAFVERTFGFTATADYRWKKMSRAQIDFAYIRLTALLSNPLTTATALTAYRGVPCAECGNRTTPVCVPGSGVILTFDGEPKERKRWLCYTFLDRCARCRIIWHGFVQHEELPWSEVPYSELPEHD